MNLVIVESPAKAKTINKYLGSEYKVIASYGHIRDLPSKNGSVDPEKDFAVIYEVDKDAERNVKAMATLAKDADSLILATDPDREGEAISWHVLEVLKEKKAVKSSTKVKRVVFNEITKKAVTEAIKNPRDIDMHLVDAQQARRVLDYLVGFNLSPILWRKLPGSRSAGRVQSVALRLICDREDEIEVFETQEYWDIKAEFLKSGSTKVLSHLTHLNGEKLEKFSLTNETDATKVAENLKGKKFKVIDIEKKQSKRNPYPPFTTSTLQQEAFRKLGFGAKRTMMLAQELYEGVDIGSETVGLITYMRTDGVDVAEEAMQEARQVIEQKYGKNYVCGFVRKYQAKTKNAQEAHEAIRPTSLARTPEQMAKYLQKDSLALYDLIWKRMMATQMESAVLDQVAVDIETEDKYAILRANGSTIKFDGFFKVYSEERDDDEEKDDNEKILPPMEVGEALNLSEIIPAQHFTEPPPRYSEASLVKKMEELGIGRPSTYASIISILQDREYVVLDKKRFVPEERGRLVTAFLRNFFPRYVEYDFTAKLEDDLDEISEGKIAWKKVLELFWKDFSANVKSTSKLEISEVIDKIDQLLGAHLFPKQKDGSDPRVCPSCSNGKLGLKLSRYGAFIGCSNYPECKYTRKFERSDAENSGADSIVDNEPRELGIDEATGLKITLRKGPYGFYIQVGEVEGKKKPKRVALPKNATPESFTLEQAKSLLSLPREVGKHPETGKVVKAGIGRFGPYVQHDGAFKSLAKEDDVLTIGINRAVVLLAEAKSKKSAKSEPLKVLGKHPDDDKEIAVYDGRYGAYVKWGKVNATLPKDETPDSITLESALGILSKKSKKGGGKTRKKKTKE